MGIVSKKRKYNTSGAMPYYLAEIDEGDELKMDIKSLVPYGIDPLVMAEQPSEQKTLISKLSNKLDDQVVLTKKYKRHNERLRQQNMDLVCSLEDVEEELDELRKIVRRYEKRREKKEYGVLIKKSKNGQKDFQSVYLKY